MCVIHPYSWSCGAPHRDIPALCRTNQNPYRCPDRRYADEITKNGDCGDCKRCGLRTPSTSASEEDGTDEDDESELRAEVDDDHVRIESTVVRTTNYAVVDVDSCDEEYCNSEDLSNHFDQVDSGTVETKNDFETAAPSATLVAHPPPGVESSPDYLAVAEN
jgi:hypothetical protein